MEMHPVYLWLDPYLIWFYRLTGSAEVNFLLGTLALAITVQVGASAAVNLSQGKIGVVQIERIVRDSQPALRARYVVGRGTLRSLLAAAVGTLPAEVPLRRGPRGRVPRLPIFRRTRARHWQAPPSPAAARTGPSSAAPG